MKEKEIMKSIEELDFETRLKVARSLISGKLNKNIICNKYGINRTTVTNIGLLYDQYGQPGLRDSSMALYSKPADIERSMQELIITIGLNHPNVNTKGIRSLLREEGKHKEPAPIQRFLTQAGLGNEELRKQYLNELREIPNARRTHGIQKFAYSKFILNDSFGNERMICSPGEYHFLLLGAISLNPRTEPTKIALLHMFINLHSLYIEILVDDSRFLPLPEKRQLFIKFRQLFSFNCPSSFMENFLWCETSLMNSSKLRNHISIGVSPGKTKIMNNTLSRLHGENQISFFNKKIDYFEFEIHYKLNFLKELERTIERSRAHNSQEGNSGLTALDFSIARIQDLANDYNSRVIEGSFPVASPKAIEENRGTNLREKPVMKLTDLFNKLFDT